MGEFSLPHLLIVVVLLLLFFGPSRLPGLGQSLGKAIRGFKDGLSDANPHTDDTATRKTELNAAPPIPGETVNKVASKANSDS